MLYHTIKIDVRREQDYCSHSSNRHCFTASLLRRGLAFRGVLSALRRYSSAANAVENSLDGMRACGTGCGELNAAARQRKTDQRKTGNCLSTKACRCNASRWSLASTSVSTYVCRYHTMARSVEYREPWRARLCLRDFGSSDTQSVNQPVSRRGKRTSSTSDFRLVGPAGD